MLTLQLLSGQEELPGLHLMDFNSQNNIDKYLDTILDCIHPLDELSENGKDFIRKCLVYSSESRMTAPEALNHRWLQEPREDRRHFRHLESAIYSTWKPREIELPIMKYLPTKDIVSNTQEPSSSAVSRFFPQGSSQHRVLDSPAAEADVIEVKTTLPCGEIKAQRTQPPQLLWPPLTPVSLRRATKKIVRCLGAPKRKVLELGGRPAKRRRSI